MATLTQAHAALRAQNEALRRWVQALQPWHPPGYLDVPRLYESNLISGMVSASPGGLPCVESQEPMG